MIPATHEDQKKEAFRLFEDGRYTESLRFCQAALLREKDPAIEVLAATNLFLSGKLEDAEVSFRDLARTMPDSSYVHSYLGKVLEALGDEGAIAEYAAAVHLDPTNQDALRSYAAYLLSHNDYRGSLRVLRHLVRLGRNPDDIRNLMRALIEVGDADEALATHRLMGEQAGISPEYIDALTRTKDYRAAAEAAHAAWSRTKDPAVLRRYLDALARYDTPASLEAYASRTSESPDTGILFDYALLQRAGGDLQGALTTMRTLIALTGDPLHRLAGCDILAESGKADDALAAYERLVRDELASKDDLSRLRLIIGRYRQFIRTIPDSGKAEKRFLGLVSADVNVASLLETARFYEERGDLTESRAWYYRAYRADYLTGGLEYARFLILHDEDRECEKVMLYILANVKKTQDLVRVAAVAVDRAGRMHRLRRLMDQLIERLSERRPALGSDGLELLAMAYFLVATNALDDGDFPACKYLCFAGIDILPFPPKALRLEDFLQLVRACKARAVADRPVILERPAKKTRRAEKGAAVPGAALAGLPGLTEQEQKIVAFLRSHRTATEMDLRKVLATRRVVGIINILIRKTEEQGISLIGKKGMGEEGEIYEYTGT